MKNWRFSINILFYF